MNWFELIQATLAPVVLISAIGLINLSLYSRYGRIHDRVRHLLHDVDSLMLSQVSEDVRKGRIEKAKYQISMLFERAELIKWSLLLLQFALVSSVIDSILIFLNTIHYVQIDFLIVLIFGVSVLLILISAILTAIEISKSLRNLRIEIEAVVKG